MRLSLTERSYGFSIRYSKIRCNGTNHALLIMKILILGATGTIAHRLAEEIALLAPQVQLRLTSSRSDGVRQLEREFPAAEVCRTDYLDQVSLESALRGVNKIMVINPDLIDENKACSNLVEATGRAGGVVHVLRLLTYPPKLMPAHITPDARAIPIGFNQGITARQVLDASDMPLTYVNVLSSFMTNLLWSAELVSTKRKFVMPCPQTQTWLHPADIAQVCARILVDDPVLHSGQTYELSGVELLSYDDIAGMLTDELGISIEYSDNEALLRELFGEGYGLYMKYFEYERDYYANVRANDTIEQFLGRQPYCMRKWMRENTGRFR